MSGRAMLRHALLAGVLGAAGMLPATPARAAELRVALEGLDPQARGRTVVWLYADAAGWARQAPPLRKAQAALAAGGRAQVRFAELPPGDYALFAMQDLDGNGTFDSGPLGIPRDRYGFSRNPRVFRRPGWGQIRFSVPAAGTALTIRMK